MMNILPFIFNSYDPVTFQTRRGEHLGHLTYLPPKPRPSKWGENNEMI